MNFTSWRSILAAAGLAIGLSFGAYKDHHRHAMTEGDEGRDALATVTEVSWDESKGRKKNFVLSIAFETESGEERKEKISVSNTLGNRMLVSDEAEDISIRYNTNNPSVAVAVGEPNNSTLKLWLAMAAGLAAAGLTAARILKRRPPQIA